LGSEFSPPKKLTANFIADFTGSWAEVSVVSWLHVDPVRGDGVMGHFYPFFGKHEWQWRNVISVPWPFQDPKLEVPTIYKAYI